MEKVNRIAIIGAPGAGKTTLSQKLNEIYNLPIFNIDTIYRLPNWVLNDPEKRDKQILEEANKEKWIIDGTFIDTLEERVKRADKIFFLDYPTRTFLKGVFKRFIQNFGQEKPEMPGCKEKIDLSFIAYVATYNIRRRKFIVEILEKYPEKDILHFRKQKDLNEWLRKKKEEIKC